MAMIRLQAETGKQLGVYYQLSSDEKPLGEGGMGKLYRGICVNEIEISSKPDWVTVDVAKKKLFVSVQENNATDERSGVVRVKCYDKEADLVVNQAKPSALKTLGKLFKKKMKIGYHILGVLLMFLPYKLLSQTVVWQMQPSNYSEITHLVSDLYIAKLNDKIGLIRSDGSIVVPIENDQIGDFYENKSLVTYTDGQRECVRGVLLAEGKYNSFSTKFYTLLGQKFYSDGLLSVADAEGRLGYVDVYGNKVLGFDGKYDKIKPFTEGYAAVFKNKRYSLIDKAGITVSFTFNGVAELYGGTNVLNGKAYVWDTNGKLYTFDILQGGTCKSVKWPSSKTLDYLYRFASLSDKTKNVPFYKVQNNRKKGIAPNLTNNLYGFSLDNGVVIPAQFSKANQFEDNLSVVCLNGKYGILKYVAGQSFQIEGTNTAIGYYAGKKAKCNFLLTVPDSWKGKVLDVRMKNSEQEFPLIRTAQGYNFELYPNRGKYYFIIEVSCEGLLLYRDSMSYVFVRKERCPVCKLDVNQCRYRGRHPEPERKTTGRGNHVVQKKTEKVCPTCGKKISKCKYQGVH